MLEFGSDRVKDKKEFTRVVLELKAKGLTQDEATDVLARDYWHLFREPTEAETRQIQESIVLRVFAEMNRESIEKNGHPEIVSFYKDGEMRFAGYDALSPEQIADFRERGIIL